MRPSLSLLTGSGEHARKPWYRLPFPIISAMASPLGAAVEAVGRFRTQETEPWARMDAPTEHKFEDLPLKPLSATQTANVINVVQRIQDAKLPLPQLEAVRDKLAKGDYITMGPQCGLSAKLDDIQSFQLARLPKENGLDLIKMVRLKIRTPVTRINAAMYSQPYMVDIALLGGRNKSPAILQKMFMGLGGNQVAGAFLLLILLVLSLFDGCGCPR